MLSWVGVHHHPWARCQHLKKAEAARLHAKDSSIIGTPWDMREETPQRTHIHSLSLLPPFPSLFASWRGSPSCTEGVPSQNRGISY